MSIGHAMACAADRARDRKDKATAEKIARLESELAELRALAESMWYCNEHGLRMTGKHSPFKAYRARYPEET